MSKKYIGRRVIAGLTDYTVIFLSGFLYIQAFGKMGDDGSHSVSGMNAIPIILFWLIYFCGSELVFGRTLGNYFVNLKPVNIDKDESINLKQSFLRHSVDILDMFFFGLIGILIIQNSKESQRLGDLIAKTKVVKL